MISARRKQMQDCERNRRRNYMRRIAQLTQLADVLQLPPSIVAARLHRLHIINQQQEVQATNSAKAKHGNSGDTTP
jgi:hypothetical protein